MVAGVRNILESSPVEACAACRIDCGGTLDIKTLSDPLKHLSPCTFNIALDMKTRVKLLPYALGRIKVSSRGLGTEVQSVDNVSFGGPLGLIFAIAMHFRVDGVHIEIASESPPRSALGGSSTAAVALIGALSKALAKEGSPPMTNEEIVLLAHRVEETVAGVPCGLQDQLAAVFGGVHAWHWPTGPEDPRFKGSEILTSKDYPDLEAALLLAYCGVPHVSHDINKRWIDQFVSGETRPLWTEIVSSTKTFVEAVKGKDWHNAVAAMNKEVEIRRKMTPDVFDEVGNALVEGALALGCGARFTGAGGGGCLWALGEEKKIGALRPVWMEILSAREDARLLEARVAPKGLQVA
ncbi:MAG: galactokinase [Deltaproteobacteria bacterium]|nr:galactokinase [Deltaproteobacteria bacterium]